MTTVEQLRRQVGLSQEYFGRRLGVTQPTISALERSRIRLSARLALLIRDAWPEQVAELGGVEALLRGSR